MSHHNKRDPSTVRSEAQSAEGCPVNMFNLRRCARPLYRSQTPLRDAVPVCIMHSMDPQKNNDAFQEEFERSLAEAEDGVANLSGFVFPTSNYRKRKFCVKCIFNRATFVGPADFFGAVFEEAAIFSEVVFLGQASFLCAAFLKEAVFDWATFAQGATFTTARFTNDAKFQGARFGAASDFNGAVFTQDALFSSALFMHDSYFNVIRPNVPAVSEKSTTNKDEPTRWPFLATVFERRADFRGATFKKRVEFRQTRFLEDDSATPGLIFSLARFDEPRLVVFYKTYLGQALLHNCDVSEFLFANVRWRERDNGKRMVFDEEKTLRLDQEATVALLSDAGPDERNYGLIAELYQQLKKNYDDRKDYWTAGDFHYGEMEMKRLATPRPNFMSGWAKNLGLAGNRFDKIRRDWHRHLGLAAWYRYGSEYGESYDRPILWLFAVLLLFTFLYPLVGLRPPPKSGQQGDAELSYSNVNHYAAMGPHGPALTFGSLLGHSMTTAIGVAGFQHDLAYEPVYPWGRLLSWVELLLTSTLITLFLLAVRRQFRR